MEQGFIPDASYGAILIGSSVEGTPEKGWTGNVKIKGKRKPVRLPLYFVWISGILREPVADASPSGLVGPVQVSRQRVQAVLANSYEYSGSLFAEKVVAVDT
jgi:hypothetical protein